jgi:DNA-binding response OmpR family regulator
VEDDVPLRTILRLTLQEAGFEPTDAGTGGEALSLLAGLAPDAVVLDLGLPDGQGKAVLDQLTRIRDPNGHRPSLAVISALSEEEAIRDYGPFEVPFLAKPFDPWALVRILESLIEEGRQRCLR